MDFFPIRLLRFATDDLPTKDRAALLREYYGRQGVGLDLIPAADCDFQAGSESLPLPGALLATARSSAVSFERTSSLLQDGNDDLILSVVSVPTRVLAEQRYALDVAAGEAVLVPMNHRWLFERGQGEALNLRIPRSALPPQCDPKPLRLIQQGSAPLRLFVGYARVAMAEHESLNAVTTQAVSRHLQELVAFMLQPDGADAPRRAELGSIAAARLALIKRDIERHLHEPGLDATWLAGRHGVKPRYIRSLFESEGTTLTTFIRTRRLYLANRMLCDPRLIRRRVAEIAMDCGFSDLSNFNRVFRRQFGLTPTEARAEALQAKYS